MSCKIIYNEQGKITHVNKPNGEESQLYAKISQSPMVESKEKAVDVYKNIYFKDINEDEVKTAYRLVDKTTTESYKEALEKSAENNEIEFGFLHDGEFTPLMSINKNTNTELAEGFKNHYIQLGLIDENKLDVNGEMKLQGAGFSVTERTFNTVELRRQAYSKLGADSLTMDGHSFTLEQTKNKTTVLMKDGSKKLMSIDEIKAEPLENFDDENEAILLRETKLTPYREKVTIKAETQTDEDLQLKSMNLLNKLGVSVMSISDYVKNYKTKNGVNPSAKALADLSEKVIALHDGEASTEDFIEEVAHFIESATTLDKKENILRNIDKTQEWGEFSEAYRAIYGEEGYSGEELEMMVRREVLGKIIKNSLLDNSNKTELERNIFQKAFDLIVDFINSLKVDTELRDYLRDIQNAVETNDVEGFLDPTQISQSPYTFYSTETTTPEAKLKRASQRTVAYLNNSISNLLGSKKIMSKADINKLSNLEKKLESAATIHSIASIVDIVHSKTKYLQEAIKDSESKGKDYVFSIEENILYQNLVQNIGKSTAEIKEALLAYTPTAEEKGAVESLIKRIDETTVALSDLTSKKSSVETQTINRLVDEIVTKYNRPDSDRQYYERWMKQQVKDVSGLASYLGTLADSQDGMLGLLGQSLVNMHHEGNTRWQNSTKKLQKKLEDLGLNEQTLAKFMDGSYILSPLDFKKFNDDFDGNYVRAFRETLPDTTLTDEEILKKNYELTADQDSEISRLEGIYNRDLTERSRKAEYYQELENRMASVSDYTKLYISNYLQSVSEYTAEARGEDGIIDYSRLSLQDQQALKDIQQTRKLAKDYYDSTTGALKSGISIAEDLDENGKIVYQLDSNPSDEAQLAWDLHKLDEQAAENFKQKGQVEKGLPKAFIEALQGKSREEQARFVELNAYVGFTDKYYEELSNWKTVDGKKSDKPSLQRQLMDSGEEGSKELAMDIAKVQNNINSLIKSWTKKNNPSEIDAESMPQATKDKVKELQKELYTLFNKSRKILKQSTDSEELSRDLNIFTEANEAFNYRLYQEPTFEKQLELIYKNVIDKDEDLIRNTKYELDQFISGNRVSAPKAIQTTAEKIGLEINENNKDAILLSYAQSKLLPYYKRTVTDDYGLVELLKDEFANINDVLAEIEKNPYIKVSPNYSFYEEAQDESINPNYVSGSKMGALQPKSDLYRNEKFYETFGSGTKVDKNGLIDLDTTQNKQLAEAYNATWEYNVEALNAMGVSKSYNYYIAPQVRHKGIDRWVSTVKGSIKNGIKDLVTFTDDDLIQGETSFGTKANVIAKPYTRLLDDPEDVSTNLFTTLALRSKEGFGRDAKVKYSGEIMAIMDTLQTRESSGGKSFETTNAYKQAQSATDYALYGIKEELTMPIKTAVGQFDLAKILNNFHQFVKLKNLGGSVIIPATAYLTGKVTQVNERLIGQYYIKDTTAQADRALKPLMKDVYSEIGKINTKATLNVYGQYFGSFDLSHSLEDSNYGFAARFLKKSTMALYSASMYSLFGHNLMYALHDIRIVDGVMQSYADFSRSRSFIKEAEDSYKIVDKAEIQNEWKQYESKAIINYISNVDGQVIFDKAKLSEELNVDDIDQEILNISNKIRTQVKNLNIKIDTQLSPEDKTKAQRNFLLNFFLSHRGFMLVASANRFKSYHLNSQTSQFEEGSYLSAYNFLGLVMKEWRDNGHKVIEAFKTSWNEASTEEDVTKLMVRRTNIKRVGTELAVMNALMVIALVLRNIADDDKNRDLYALQALNLLAYRTAVESHSTQLGIGNTYASVLNDPIMAWSSAKSMADITKLFDSTEVRSDKSMYEGQTNRGSQLMKLLPYTKQVLELNDLNGKYKTLQYFTEEKSNQLSTVPAYVFYNSVMNKEK